MLSMWHDRLVAIKRTPRPRDAIAVAKFIGDIATGEVAGTIDGKLTTRAKAGGRKGGPARAVALTPQQRAEIARAAANARWKKSD